MESIEILYNTALLQVAEKIQRGTFYCARVYVGRDGDQTARRTNLFLTPRVRATQKILAALARALSGELTPQTIATRTSNIRIKKTLALPKPEMEVFLQGGAEALCRYHKMMFAYALEELGVTRKIAYEIADCIVMHRSESLSFFNAVDDIGIEETMLASDT